MNVFGNAFSGWHLLLILAIIVLLFGATKLPALAKSLGESMRIIRTESKDPDDAASSKVGSSEPVATAEADVTRQRPVNSPDLPA